MKKIVNAPGYFLDLGGEIKKVEERMAENLGVSWEWLSQNLRNRWNNIDERVNDLPRGKQGEMRMLSNIFKGYSNFRWMQFRFNNLDNEFGMAEKLNFDPDKKTISIQKGLVNYVEEFIEKLRQKFPESKIEDKSNN